MCVAVPGKVIELQGGTAQVDFSGNVITARTGLVNVKVGDAVLVHGGCILQVISQKEDDELAALFRELEELS